MPRFTPSRRGLDPEPERRPLYNPREPRTTTEPERTPRPVRVDRIAAEMMDTDNDLMRRAAASGLQTANRRGLGNSSISVGASQAAVLDEIIPMASQVSDQRFNRREQARQADIDLERLDQEAALRRRENRQTERLSRRSDKISDKREARLDAKRNEQVAELDRRADRQSDRREARLQDRSNEQLAKLDRRSTRLDDQLAKERDRLARRFDMKVKNMEISADVRRGSETMIDNNFNDYQDAIRSIMSNTDLPASERNQLIRNEKKLVELRMKLIEDFAGVELEWPKGLFRKKKKPEETEAEAT